MSAAKSESSGCYAVACIGRHVLFLPFIYITYPILLSWSLNVRLSDSNFFGLFCCLIQDFEPYVMITSALMLVKRSETAIAVQLCRFLCRFMQLFIYQRKKNTYQYIKVVMISGQMYSPRGLYFAGNIGFLL